ncbi:hypothetical protein FUA23_01585 [Neolewinella aurantiaca]|uniref:DUF6089 domain-containing protein n=1 Tax=Neolewinella aurantiaca TaxID=2602767 RepID=A0A5C7FJF4_9BACT|nr:DUF6089 family protein [Neolewinella aurantiaca]TXF91415.1 hypothetical protein FUA23_01585 [Neolewinella aurantiaca]
MQTRFSFLLSILFVIGGISAAQAQELEFGLKAGTALYSGDLSPKEFGLYPDDLNFAGGLYLRYRPGGRFGIRVNGDFGRISAERDDMRAPNEMGVFLDVTRNFRSSITEFNAVLEYDLFYLGNRDGNYFAPYIFGGVGVLSFNPEGEMDGVYTELQPLATEGQGSGLSPAYDATPYELTTVVGVFGGGVRVRFADRIVVGLELGGRKTGTDYLDDISDTRVNYLDVLQGDNGGLAARFSNPAVQDPAEVGDLSYSRGGDAEDYYFIGSLTVGITIGASGSNKSGCYKF